MSNPSEKLVPRNKLPEDFLANIRGREEINFEKFRSAMSLELPIISFRLNPLKKSKSINLEESTPVPWTDHGYYLSEKKLFSQDPSWHAGEYYVQEASSMFIGYVFKALIQERSDELLILDTCAAPGGKSTNLLSHLRPKFYLLSNEVIQARKQILKENICKWGYPNVGITNKSVDLLKSLGAIFDLVFVDAPCSGEGLFRRLPAYCEDWNLDLVNLCQLRQKKILSNSLELVKPGGHLIYSTCTFNHEENINNVVWLAQQFNLKTVSISIPETWNITTIAKEDYEGYQFFPHKTKGEGFFIAVLQKSGEPKKESKKSRKKKNDYDLTLYEGTIPSLIGELPSDWKLYINEYKELIALPQSGKKLIDNSISKQIKIENQILGQFKGQDFIPSHFLAMSNLFAKETPQVNLTKVEALHYLNRAPIHLPDAPKGWLLIKHGESTLGWVKNLVNRINNYYPKQFRLRKIED